MGLDAFQSLAANLAQGWNIAIGNKTDDWYQHLYVKQTDTQRGELADLDQSDWRARFENRLGGAKLPFQTADDLRLFRFETLAPLFSQRRERDNLQRTSASAQIGERRTRNRREGGTRQYSQTTEADTAINKVIRQALKDLSERWNRTRHNKPKNDNEISTLAEKECVFSQSTAQPCGFAGRPNNYIANIQQLQSTSTNNQAKRSRTGKASSSTINMAMQTINPATRSTAMRGASALHSQTITERSYPNNQTPEWTQQPAQQQRGRGGAADRPLLPAQRAKS
jgi:hypothetical protein